MRWMNLVRGTLTAAAVLIATTVQANTQTLTFVDDVDPGLAPCGIASARVGKNQFVLVGSHLDDKISSFRLDRKTGAMTKADEASVAPGSRPVAIGFAYGRYAVVANQESADLYVFRMDRDGKFVENGDPVGTGGLAPADMVVAPTGLIAVTNSGSGDVSAFWLDPKGDLHDLGKKDSGLAPAGITHSGRNVYVANTGSQNLVTFRVRGKKAKMRFEIDNTTAILAAPLDVTAVGKDVYVSTAPTAQGAQAKLFHFRKKKGGLQGVGDVDAGLFLSGVASDKKLVLGGALNDASRNEVRVYDRRLSPTSSATIGDSGPSTLSIASARVRGGRYVIVSEFHNATTSSFRLDL